MSGRRGFLAFVGGTLLGGTAVKVQAEARPTLILPVRPALLPSVQDTAWATLATFPTEFDAILHIRQNVSRAEYHALLECGLHMANNHRGQA